MSSAPVGLVGLGLLGSALARRLGQAGYPIVGFDVAPERRDALAGTVAVAAEVAEVAACDRIVLSLPTSKEVAAVLSALEPALRQGTVIVDTTTGDPETVEPLGRHLDGRGVGYLDATISGSSADVERGEAIGMVGGPADVVARAAPILSALVRRWHHVGGWGDGTRLKLVTNLALGLHRAVLAEALGLAASMGLDLAATLAVLRESAAYSRVMDTKGDKMVRGDFAPQARLSQHLKDVRLILAEGERTGAKLPLSELHARLLEAVEALGLGDRDNSAVLRAFLPPPAAIE